MVTSQTTAGSFHLRQVQWQPVGAGSRLESLFTTDLRIAPVGAELSAARAVSHISCSTALALSRQGKPVIPGELLDGRQGHGVRIRTPCSG